MLNSGRLADHDHGHDASGRRLIEVVNLKRDALTRMRRRIDSPHWNIAARRPQVGDLEGRWGDREDQMLDALNGQIEALVVASGIAETPELHALVEGIAMEVAGFLAALSDGER